MVAGCAAFKAGALVTAAGAFSANPRAYSTRATEAEIPTELKAATLPTRLIASVVPYNTGCSGAIKFAV